MFGRIGSLLEAGTGFHPEFIVLGVVLLGELLADILGIRARVRARAGMGDLSWIGAY